MKIISLGLDKILIDLAKKSDKIKVAVAFLTDNQVLDSFISSKKEVELIVSLRPPTSPSTLRKVYLTTNTRFLGVSFHSKIYAFYEGNKLTNCVIGSSNFTNGGLVKNIETNVLIDDVTLLKQVEQHLSDLWVKSYTLQPSDIDRLEMLTQEFNANRASFDKKLIDFQERISKRDKLKNEKISKVAQEYLQFWKFVDDIKGILEEDIEQHYPDLYPYLVIDVFWDWLKKEWQPDHNSFNHKKIRIELPILFNHFIESENYNIDVLKDIHTKARKIKRYLSESKIDKLTVSQAQDVYSSLNAMYSTSIRFNFHEDFVDNNDIKKIRQTFKYLLYDDDDVELRIHNALKKDGVYKLEKLGKSGVQELLGWVFPEKYPCRNNKANEGVEYLGYKF